MSQLNKLQLKAEIFSVISKLQTNLEAEEVEKLLHPLLEQEDKEFILDLLAKEFVKSDSQKIIAVAFMMIKLCDKASVENVLWQILANPSVDDATKALALELLKDMGNKVDYQKIEECFAHPEDVVDADTKRLLHVAIVNPEAQIDFLDFLMSLSDEDKKALVLSLGDDYSSDDLANILNPLFTYSPESEIGKIAANVLGDTKSQLALHTLSEALEFIDDEEVGTIVKKNISKLKIAGVREDNAEEFYKSVLATSPYSAYTSYPDGHGNQAILFAREREDDTVQMVAVVVSDVLGIVDCFGFNQISKGEFERIVSKFYGNDDRVYINPHIVKTLFNKAENLTRKLGKKVSYEYICWKNLLVDISPEAVPIELVLSSNFSVKPLSLDDFLEICDFDFVSRWFFDVDFCEEFKTVIDSINQKVMDYSFDYDFNFIIEENIEKIFTNVQKTLLDKRILLSAYLKYLAGEKNNAELLYSLHSDEKNKTDLQKNIFKKSVYEYYVSQKFKYKEEHKMTNIFALKNKKTENALSLKQIDEIIAKIENAWVNN